MMLGHASILVAPYVSLLSTIQETKLSLFIMYLSTNLPQATTRRAFIRKNRNSKIGSDTDYYDRGSLWFFSAPPGYYTNGVLNSINTVVSNTLLLFHNSLISNNSALQP